MMNDLRLKVFVHDIWISQTGQHWLVICVDESSFGVLSDEGIIYAGRTNNLIDKVVHSYGI